MPLDPICKYGSTCGAAMRGGAQAACASGVARARDGAERDAARERSCAEDIGVIVQRESPPPRHQRIDRRDLRDERERPRGRPSH